ncbi:hypothetical protein SCUCBS95973_001497 [Sporothrix curviconia]|uniref:Uncharacterized protein n=1 Tax=Sporothrix curviconia TaxID=1260050 RepID=A0ABP0AZ29_9PEZI
MLLQETLVGLAAATLIGFARPTVAYTTACLYQEYKCGSELFGTDGYNMTELMDAVNATTTIPPLQDYQLMDVIYRCIDINGNIAGNSYCIAGCIGMASTANDQCAM